MPDLKLFYAPGACSPAPHIVLEETGESFTPVLIDTKSGEHRKPDFLRINPKARVPALGVNGWVLTENAAILQFIGLSYPGAGLWPCDLQGQAMAVEWLAWIASTVHVAYAHVRRAERYATSEAAIQDVRATGLEASREVWAMVEQKLGADPWALGQRYSAVDAYPHHLHRRADHVSGALLAAWSFGHVSNSFAARGEPPSV